MIGTSCNSLKIKEKGYQILFRPIALKNGNKMSKSEITKCKWYYKPFWVWVFILSIGPFALPFLIRSPRFNKISKWIISIAICIVTVYFTYSGYQAYQIINNPEELKAMLQKHLTPEQMEMFNMFEDMMNGAM